MCTLLKMWKFIEKYLNINNTYRVAREANLTSSEWPSSLESCKLSTALTADALALYWTNPKPMDNNLPIQERKENIENEMNRKNLFRFRS